MRSSRSVGGGGGGGSASSCAPRAACSERVFSGQSGVQPEEGQPAAVR